MQTELARITRAGGDIPSEITIDGRVFPFINGEVVLDMTVGDGEFIHSLPEWPDTVPVHFVGHPRRASVWINALDNTVCVEFKERLIL